MITESLLLMAYEGSNVASMVSQGCIGFLLQIKTHLLQISTEKLPVCTIAMVNLSQCLAKLVIKTPPQLLQGQQNHNMLTCLVDLIDPETSHH